MSNTEAPEPQTETTEMSPEDRQVLAEATRDEQARFLEGQNKYLTQRVVALNFEVRKLQDIAQKLQGALQAAEEALQEAQPQSPAKKKSQAKKK